ncbi:MAG: nuclear transport factor 2 family protein [Gammaproteobacteria bacterium]|nr:nuclear transport factor 2 family protein [Gammaproteobacteria bacterium]MDD9959808.1 nuclear transport factor 2 family protein [Gammaproteobacteria bacterium]
MIKKSNAGKISFAAILILFALVMITANTIEQAQADHHGEQMALSGKDYEEIKSLYARYNQGSDFRDTELFLSAFAEDAIMTREGGDIVGLEGLRADRARRYQGATGDVGRRHLNGSYLIMPTSEGAEAKTYYILMDVTERPPSVIGSGYYEDKFIRTEDGWKIKHRTLYRDTLD